MSSNNWEQIGEEIRRTVQDAVENQNYDQLNQMISNTINQAVDVVSRGVKNAAASSRTQYHGYKTYTTDYDHANRATSKSRESKKRDYAGREDGKKAELSRIPAKLPSKFGVLATTALGYAFGGIQLFWFVFYMAASVIAGTAFGVSSGLFGGIYSMITAALMGLGFYFGISGTRKVIRMDRFLTYVKTIGTKEYCNISDLTHKVGKSGKVVIKDLEYMIRKGWFSQGHLDQKKTCLMVTDQMYSQYCRIEQQRAVQLEEKKEQELSRQKEKASAKETENIQRADLPLEVQKIIELGDEYVRKIHACNDSIPGAEISEKISKIEMLVDKIFDRVENNPKSVSDIQKMMDYYLPTTVKLLEAYAEMDAQPAGGVNIQTAKREIEATLDTLNVAFEKLLDSLFQETAWDVSSDISVLNTMLAQEGLKEDGLRK